MPAACLHEEVFGAGDSELNVVVGARDDFGLNVHCASTHIEVKNDELAILHLVLVLNCDAIIILPANRCGKKIHSSKIKHLCGHH